MGPTALGIDPWGGGATAPEGQSPLVGWASWPMKAGPACRRSRGTTTTTSIYDPPRSWDNGSAYIQPYVLRKGGCTNHMFTAASTTAALAASSPRQCSHGPQERVRQSCDSL